MTTPLLTSIDLDNLGDGLTSRAKSENIIAGDPLYTTWKLAESHAGKVTAGVWQATPATTRSVKGDRFEFCHILEGVVEITERGKSPVTYRAGDSFLMHPGFVGEWRTIETVRKIYVLVD